MPFAPTRLAKVKKSDNTTCWGGWLLGTLALLVRMWLWYDHFESNFDIIQPIP